jgi:membrane protease YdiL (CAAX protease family)
MTLVVWLTSKFAKKGTDKIYWVGILVTSAIFSLAHLPTTFQAVKDPSIVLVTYLLIAISIGGIIFGWLYWKKGLESAFIGHICSHIVIVIGEPFIG